MLRFFSTERCCDDDEDDDDDDDGVEVVVLINVTIRYSPWAGPGWLEARHFMAYGLRRDRIFGGDEMRATPNEHRSS